MPKAPITTFSSLNTSPSATSSNNGLYVPRLTAAEIAAIPTTGINPTLQNGGIIYNTDTNTLQFRINNNWVNFGGGGGNVSNNTGGIAANIPIFADNTGTVLQDSGVAIAQVPAFARNTSLLTDIPNVNVNEISNIGHIKFNESTGGAIYVGGLSPVSFNEAEISTGNFQICSVFTSGLADAPTTVSSLVEINSTEGALVLSRMDTAARDDLFQTSGMVLYNTDSNLLDFYNGSSWVEIGSGGGYGPGNPTYFIDTSSDFFSYNFYAGTKAGNTMTAAHNNTAIGYNTLNRITNGLANVSVGYQSLMSTKDGSGNVAVGWQAMYNGTTNMQNVAIGMDSGNVGNNNVWVGYAAGAGASGACTSSVLLGSGAVTSTIGLTNAIAIGANAIVGQSNAMVLGDGTINVGIGTSTPNTSAILDLTSTTKALLFPRTTVGSIVSPIDGMMVYDTSLNSFNIHQAGSWVTIENGNVTGPGSSITGDIAIFSDTTGEVISDSGINISNVYSAGNPTTIIDTSSTTTNFAIGTEALANNTSGEGNLAVGFQALLNNASGLSNLAIGCTTLLNNTTGNYNLAIGFGALQNNTIGLHNLAIGYQALENNTTGNYNLAIGEDTLGKTTGNNNLAFGFQAAFNNTTGNYNVVFGYQAAFNNTTGNSNLAVGQSALKNNITGANNVALGFQAGTTQASYSLCTFLGSGADASVSGLTNAIAIGANAIVGQSNAMVLGNGVNVGIGTSTPNTSAILDLTSTNRALLLPRAPTDSITSPIDGMMVYNTALNSFNMHQAGSWVTIENGNVTGPGSSITGDIAIFSDTTGEVISDSGINISEVYSAGNPTTIIDTSSGSPQNFYIGTEAGNITGSGGLNTGVGLFCLRSMGDGTQNTAIGFSALLVCKDGSTSNVAVGAGAGTGYDTYNKCTFLGTAADASSPALTNATAIGFNAHVGVDNALVLGNGVNVGIGSNSPTYSLHLGTDNSSTPLICLESTSIPSTPSGTRGIYSNISGQPYFRSATDTYSGALVTASTSITGAPTSGIAMLTTGAVGVGTTAIQSSSIVLVTYTTGSSVPSFANTGILQVGSINPGVGFTIRSNNNMDTSMVFWQIINPA